MSEHAEPQQEELKNHGDPLEPVEESLGGVSRKEQDQDADTKSNTSKE